MQAETQACEIRLRAERRCGQLLKNRDMATGTLKLGTELPQSHVATTETLSDLGIKTQSSRWQKLAAYPRSRLRSDVCQQHQEAHHRLIAAHAPKSTAPVIPVDPLALWLWGRLLDFERMGVLAAI